MLRLVEPMEQMEKVPTIMMILTTVKHHCQQFGVRIVNYTTVPYMHMVQMAEMPEVITSLIALKKYMPEMAEGLYYVLR